MKKSTLSRCDFWCPSDTQSHGGTCTRQRKLCSRPRCRGWAPKPSSSRASYCRCVQPIAQSPTPVSACSRCDHEAFRPPYSIERRPIVTCGAQESTRLTATQHSATIAEVGSTTYLPASHSCPQPREHAMAHTMPGPRGLCAAGQSWRAASRLVRRLLGAQPRRRDLRVPIPGAMLPVTCQIIPRPDIWRIIAQARRCLNARNKHDGRLCAQTSTGWGDPLLVATDPAGSEPCWNPVLVHLPASSQTILFFKVRGPGEGGMLPCLSAPLTLYLQTDSRGAWAVRRVGGEQPARVAAVPEAVV